MATKKKRFKLKKYNHRERSAQERARVNSISVGGPLVIDFGDPTLREAFRIWWSPYDMGADFDELTGRDAAVIRTRRTKRGGIGTIKRIPAKHPVMHGDTIERRKLDPAYYRRIERAFASVPMRKAAGSRIKPPSAKPAPVRVIIRLNYPLSEAREKIVTIDRRYPGEIFALTHDFYRELYAEDESKGGKAGPMNGGKGPILNRGRGPLVWGHDLGDLAFESCHYRNLPTKDAKRVGAEGEFTFGIGS